MNLNPSKPIFIDDARGKMVPLVSCPDEDERPKTRWWNHNNPDYLDEPWKTEQTVENYVFDRCFILAAVFAMPLLAHLKGWIFPVAPSILVGTLFYLAVGFSIRPIFAAIRHNYRASRRKDLRIAYLSVNRCPSCGFSLSDLQPAEDGCIVCPECASAWRDQSPEHIAPPSPVP